MGPHSIVKSNAGPEEDSVRLAARQGTHARATGQASSPNPYLGIAVNQVELNEAQHAEWVLCCRAWWKTWDDEEARRRPHLLRRDGASPWTIDRECALGTRSGLLTDWGSDAELAPVP